MDAKCEICVPKPVRKVTYLDLESTSEEEFNDSFTDFLKNGISSINQKLILGGKPTYEIGVSQPMIMEACLRRRATCGAETRYS